MVPLKSWVQTHSRAVIAEYLRADPAFNRLVEHLRQRLPEQILAHAATYEAWVLEGVVAELRTTIEQIDTKALARALLSNQALQGKVAVSIHDLGLGLTAQIQQAIHEQIQQETAQIQNLLLARRAKEKADAKAAMKERDRLKLLRERERAKGQLLWYRLSALQIAIPILLGTLCLGAVMGLNYPVSVGCERGDLVCSLRVRSIVWD
jgi:hypothetical protein